MKAASEPSRYFGRRVPRREDGRLLRGQGCYIADVRRPGCCELVVIRSTQPHARIVAVDLEEARRQPGVLGAFTHDDFAGHMLPMPCVDMLPNSKPVHQKALARDRVRFVGEPVAVLVAENRYVAEDAAEKVRINYEALPAVLDVSQASRDGAPLLYPEHGTNVVQTLAQRVGDYEESVRRAEVVYRETFTFHRYCASPMEGRGVVAEADPATGNVTVWLSTQFPQFARGFVAESLGLPRDRVRLIAPDIGGGFGLKEAVYPEDVLVPLAAIRVGRPVRWIEDRRENFSGSSHARECTVDVEAAALRDGTVLGMKVRCLSNIGGAYATVANTPGNAMVAMARMAYRIPNLDAEVRSVVTNKTPLNVYRGAGHPQTVVVVEKIMDRLARRLGIDRFEIRRRNMLTPAELPSDRGTAYPSLGRVIFDSGDYSGSLDVMLDRFRIREFPAEQERARAEGKLLGIGISFLVEVTSTGPEETARIRLNEDATLTLFSGVTPVGQGSATAHAQMVAEELQVGIERVRVVHGDTALIPKAVGTLASRGGAVGGAAARLAARAWTSAALRMAAELMGTPLDGLEWAEGEVRLRSKAPGGMGLSELARRAAELGAAALDRLDVSHCYKVAGVAYANACHAAVIEIDPGLGRVRVRRYGVVHDCGPMINPQIVEGQIIGGVMQGIGGTLNEELRYGASGQLLNPSLMDYVLPNADDVPEFMLAHMQTPSPHNPFGMKGAGEGGFTGAPAALINAIEDALSPWGIEFNDSGPFTPSRILELLRQRPLPPASVKPHL
jgi:carbon-monoxide dehydrogenase large subunit